MFVAGILAGTLLFPERASATVNASWNTSSSGTWSTTSNWSTNSIPGDLTSPGSGTATFGNQGASPITVTITDTTRYLTEVVFGSGASAYTITGGALSFQGNGSSGPNAASSFLQIVMNSGVTNDETIDSAIQINRTTTGSFGFTANSATSSLIFNGNITWLGASGTSAWMNLGGTGKGAINGVISNSAAGGTLGLFENSGSTWTLTNANTYTGNTWIGGGTLKLDFSAGTTPSNIVSSSSALQFGGSGNGTSPAILSIAGASNAATTQTFNGTTLNGAQASHIVLSPTGTGTVTLNLGAITVISARTGETLDLAFSPGASTVTTTAANQTNNTLAGIITVNGTDFASVNGSGNIVGYSTLYSYKSDASTNWNGSTNLVDVTSAAVDLTANATSVGTISDLRFNTPTASTITLGSSKTLTIGSSVQGALLMTQNVGGNVVRITGGTLTGMASRDLVLIQNDTATGALLQIDSTIANPNTNAMALTKSGAGSLLLTGANTYTGATYLNEGTLIVDNASGGGLGTGTVAIAVANGATLQVGNNDANGSLASTQTVTDNGTVAFQRTDSALSFSNVISGSGSVAQRGTGKVTLTGTNTYTGGTSITAGTLALGNAAALGSSSGALSVSGGTLDLAGYSVTASSLTGSSSATGSLINTSATAASVTASALTPGGNGTVGALVVGGSGSVGTTTLVLTNAVLTFDIASNSSYDTITLGSAGAIAFSGTTLNLNYIGSSLSAGSFILISAANSSQITNPSGLTLGTTTINGLTAALSFDAAGDVVLNLTGAAVPEPATWLLLGCGGALLLFRRNVRRLACK